MALRSVFFGVTRIRYCPILAGSPCKVRYASSSKDELPDVFPKTQEEWKAAAKKYNMHLHDYQVYPDDGLGLGDYPMLPDVSSNEKDPHYDWDDPSIRRNWGEPLHFDSDMYLRSRLDKSPVIVPWNTMCKHLFIFIGGMLFFFFLGSTFPSHPPMAPKQFPFQHPVKGGHFCNVPKEEKKHYVF
uniref:NADH dehydrogenase [ubiquinone] 1 beta subcomplex subunit 8, mitochondrial-like n=1 Tax=Myxine glutinosa TaxID=7769 RepID=UPI00358FE13B